MTVNIRDTIRHYIKDTRGAATSLIEVTIVLAIIATLAAVVMTASSDTIDKAGIARATADTKAAATAIHSFMQDTGFAPAFKSGTPHAPGDFVYWVLTSEGSDPAIDASLGWPTDAAKQGSIENQLITNHPGGTDTSYPRMGKISLAQFRGWNGPYLNSVPVSDPWDDKYLVTVQWLTPQGVAGGSLALADGQRAAAFVISAGPNRTIETQFAQTAEGFTTGGDDIVYRIQ